jgi:C-terminal processing protease CtpA/Prc
MSRLGLLALLATLVASPSLARGQSPPPSGQDRSRGHRMLRQVREQLEKYYYDTTYHGVDLAQTYGQADSAIDLAGSLPEMMGSVAQFLANLKDSHTSFYPPGYTVTVVYGWSLQAIGDGCYVVAVKPGSDAAKKGLKVGDLVLALDGIRPTRENLHVINYVYYQLSPRPGARLVVEHPSGQQEEIKVEAEVKRGPPIVDVKDLEQRRFLEEQWRREGRHPNHHRKTFGDSVMVWRMHSFAFGNGIDYSDEMIDRNMAEARKHRYLILDLRGNGGGAVVTERRLLGHLFGAGIPLGTDVRRDTTVRLSLEPVGSAPYEGEVMVLIDSRSASASEITARILQLRGRATVIGDRSAGAVMTSVSRWLTLGSMYEERVLSFGMSVTVSDIVMPDGKSLEGTGVIPNIAVLPTATDLAEERDPALAFALELAGVKIDAREAAKIFNEGRTGG